MQRSVTLSAAAVLALGGGVAWLIGSSALEAGVGTAVLALGIGVTVWLARAGSRGPGERPLQRWRARRLVRLVLVGIALVAGLGTLIGVLGYGELGIPLGFGVAGLLLLPASSLLGSRSYLLLGAALMLLAAVGALLGLNSAGDLYPRGLVGLVAGVLLWVAAAHHAGLIGEVRGRVRR